MLVFDNDRGVLEYVSKYFGIQIFDENGKFLIKNKNNFNIKKVIFNDPATIVYWNDKTRTIVKCGQDDIFDKEKGLAMAFAKRAMEDKGNYNDVFKKWCE